MRCRADNADAFCVWRSHHRANLRYGDEAATWVWHASPLLVFAVTRCPGCGGFLPTPATLAKRWAAGDFGPDEEEG